MIIFTIYIALDLKYSFTYLQSYNEFINFSYFEKDLKLQMMQRKIVIQYWGRDDMIVRYH